MTKETMQRKQREACRVRSGNGRCQAEEQFTLLPPAWMYATRKPDETLESMSHVRWETCNKVGTVAAHIYQRRACGKARDLPEVVILTCVDHNRDHLADGRNGVRAPLQLAQEAYDAIIAVSRETASLGPRPEHGEYPY